MGIKVTIDREDCISCGACWAACADIFEEDPDDNYSRIVAKYQVAGDRATGDIPAELEKCAKDAADGCPVTIIHVG